MNPRVKNLHRVLKLEAVLGDLQGRVQILAGLLAEEGDQSDHVTGDLVYALNNSLVDAQNALREDLWESLAPYARQQLKKEKEYDVSSV